MRPSSVAAARLLEKTDNLLAFPTRKGNSLCEIFTDQHIKETLAEDSHRSQTGDLDPRAAEIITWERLQICSICE